MAMTLVRPCAACGVGNRVPLARLADRGRCGSCKGELRPMAEPLEVESAEAFQEIISQAKVPVLVDFWAAWCGPCKMAAPEVAALAGEMAGKALVLKVDTERHPGLAGAFRVQSIPNFIVFAGGRPVLQRAGVAPRSEMRRWLEQAGA